MNITKKKIIDALIYAGVLMHISMFFPPPFLGSDARDISIWVAFILILFTRKSDIKEVFLNKLSLLFIVYFVFVSISTVFYVGLSQAYDDIIFGSPAWGFLLFFSLQMLCKSKNKNDNIFALSVYPFFLMYVAIGVFIPLCMGIDYGFPGVSAFGAWHNQTARHWNLVFPVSFTSLFLINNKKIKYILLFFIFLSLIGIPLTLSRGGIISFALLLILIMAGFMFNKPDLWKSARRYIAAGAVAFSGAILIFWGRFARRFSEADWQSISGRADKIWPEILGVIKERPLTGYGFTGVYRTISFYTGHSHNFFLQVVFEGGIIGFIIFLCLWFFYLKESLRQIYKEKVSMYGLSFLCAAVAVIMVHGLIEIFSFEIFSFFLLSIWFYEAYRRLNYEPE